jgi:hypothetical protein
MGPRATSSDAIGTFRRFSKPASVSGHIQGRLEKRASESLHVRGISIAVPDLERDVIFKNG